MKLLFILLMLTPASTSFNLLPSNAVAQNANSSPCSQGPTVGCAESLNEPDPRQTEEYQAKLTSADRQALQFLAALDSLNIPKNRPSVARSPEGLSPRDVVDEANRIFDELIDLPVSEAGADAAWALEKRLDTIAGAVGGMRNSSDWEDLFEIFFRQQHLLGQAISNKRNAIFQKLKEQAPQKLIELKAKADRLAIDYGSKIDSLNVPTELLDSVIVLRVTIYGESPLAWLTARQWLALAINRGAAAFIDAQATDDGLIIIFKEKGKQSVAYVLRPDYGELYLAGVRVGDRYLGASNHQRQYEFETYLGQAVGYSRP